MTHEMMASASTWSAVVKAGGSDADAARRALQDLLAAYWRPIRSYVQRRWQKSAAEARQLTEAFLSRLQPADFPGRQRFRASLKAAIEKFMSGGSRDPEGGRKIALDDSGPDEENTRTREASSPDEVFRREWVRSTFRDAIEKLRDAYGTDGKRTYMKVFERLHLSSESDVSYESVARDLDLNIWDVTNCLADARLRLRDLIAERVREYALTEEEQREETADLMRESPPLGRSRSDQAIASLQRMLAGPSEPAPAPPEAASKARLGKYRMIRALGSRSWVVSDGIRPTELVLHMLGNTADPSVTPALCADLKPLALLVHPIIVTYHKLSTAGGWYFTVRDFVIGDSLETVSLAPPDALRAFHEIVKAMEFAHERGVVHGAIKPSNIIVSRSGPLFVVDFAIRQVESHFLPGPPRRPTPAEDADALKALLMSLLSGRPFAAVMGGEKPALRHVHRTVDPLLEDIVRAPFSNAKELAFELGRVIKKLPEPDRF